MSDFDGGTSPQNFSEEELRELEINQAEYKRVASVMQLQFNRQMWKAVEKSFGLLEDLHQLGVELNAEELIIAAEAAQQMGRIQVVLERLKRAEHISENKDTQRWIDDLEQTYGLVVLTVTSRGKVSLTPEAMPMDPTQAQAIKFAQDQITQKREFTGLLPVGKYYFLDQDFTVTAGITVQLDISPRLRKKGIKKATPED